MFHYEAVSLTLLQYVNLSQFRWLRLHWELLDKEKPQEVVRGKISHSACCAATTVLTLCIEKIHNVVFFRLSRGLAPSYTLDLCRTTYERKCSRRSSGRALWVVPWDSTKGDPVFAVKACQVCTRTETN